MAYGPGAKEKMSRNDSFGELMKFGYLIDEDGNLVRLKLEKTGEEDPAGRKYVALQVSGGDGGGCVPSVGVPLIDESLSTKTNLGTGNDITPLFEQDISTALSGTGANDKQILAVLKDYRFLHSVTIACKDGGNGFSNTRITIVKPDGSIQVVLDESTDDTQKFRLSVQFDPIFAAKIQIDFIQTASVHQDVEVGTALIEITNPIIIGGGVAFEKYNPTNPEGSAAMRNREVFSTLALEEEDIDITSVELDTTTTYGAAGPWECESIFVRFTNAFLKDVTISAEHTASGKTTLIYKWTGTNALSLAYTLLVKLPAGWEIEVDSANKVSPAGTADVFINGVQRLI
jgi:hypothetical protein